MIRDDLSSKLVHLTSGDWDNAAVTFQKIVGEKRLRGGTGGIKDNLQCVCFSEAPISKLSTILANPSQLGFRYAPFGVMVDKEWLFKQGGRPVIYQSEDEYKLLHRDQRYRHKQYEPDKDIDFTWEREWRIRTEELLLDPSNITLVVPNRSWETKVLSERYGKIFRRAALETPIPRVMIENEWHILVLEDLGVALPEDESE